MAEQYDGEYQNQGTSLLGLPAPKPEKMVQRDEPDVSSERTELITEWMKKIHQAEEYHKEVFDEMRESADFAGGNQWPGQTKNDGRYVANITLRHVNQRVASIYAKNPSVQADRKEKIWFADWDGTQKMMDEAQKALMYASNPQLQQSLAQAGMPPPMMSPEQAQSIVTEAKAIQNERQMYKNMGRTLELVAQYSLDETIPRFKIQAKQLVRRVQTCKVGYIKLGYQRIMVPSPEVDAKIKDATDRIAYLESLSADLADGEIDEHSSEAEMMRLNLESLMEKRDILLREGLVFGFPKAWSVIVDPNCLQLKGFVGADWIAEKYLFTPRQVQMIYGIDVRKGYSAYKPEEKPDSYTYMATGRKKRPDTADYCSVYEIYDLVGQTCFTIIDGYKDFIKKPGEPDITLEQFHPYFALTFNDIESDGSIYPPSDVELMRPMAIEYNRSREGLRIHRISNAPAWVAPKGIFEEDDKKKLSSHVNFELLELTISKNDDVNKLLTPKPTAKVDPALYDTEAVFVDSQRVVGSQAEDMGGASSSSATSASIAEGSRVNSLQSNIDDLDEFLTDLMRAAGQVLLMEMAETTAKEIAGPGAVWPSLNREQIAKELILTVKAGSSGKPNKAGRIAAVEKLAPYLLQMPNIDTERLASYLLQELDENIDIDDFLKSGEQSVVAANNQSGMNRAPAPGNAAQAPAGQNNAEQPKQSPAKMQNVMPSGYEQQLASGVG